MNEDTLQRELAICCRISEYLGLFDFSGHASARIEGTDTFLINSRDSVRSCIELKDIIKVNLDGSPVDANNKPPSEVYIHSTIYRERPDVFSVAHLHSPAIIELSVAGKTFTPVINRGSYFADGVPVYDDCQNIGSDERGLALAQRLGDKKAVIIRGHGSVVVGENIKAVLFGSHFAELNAKYQISAYHMGEEPRALKDNEKSEYSAFWSNRIYEKVWNYYLDKANINF